MKGQASLEYLSTYLWALLILAVTIGGLSYFGALSPDLFIPENCESGSQISCTDGYLDTGGTLYFQFKNNYNQELEIEEVGVTSHNAINFTTPTRVLSGKTVTALLTIKDSVLLNEKIRLSYVITYKRYDSASATTIHQIEGDAVFGVQKPDSQTGVVQVICGDGVRAGAEACDPPGLGGCGQLKYCLSDCTCQSTCGNGEIDIVVGESCDGSATPTGCGGSNVCTSTCTGCFPPI